MTDFGSDFSALDDLDPLLTFLSTEAQTATALAQACYRRLTTPRGGNFYDPSYGTDIRQFLVDLVNPKIVEAAIAAELLKDERVAFVKVTITVDPDTNAWTIAINPQDEFGAEYELIFQADATKLELLTVS